MSRLDLLITQALRLLAAAGFVLILIEAMALIAPDRMPFQ